MVERCEGIYHVDDSISIPTHESINRILETNIQFQNLFDINDSFCLDLISVAGRHTQKIMVHFAYERKTFNSKSFHICRNRLVFAICRSLFSAIPEHVCVQSFMLIGRILRTYWISVRLRNNIALRYTMWELRSLREWRTLEDCCMRKNVLAIVMDTS